MRAVVCKELGPVEKLVLDTDWQVGAPGPDEVVIDVKAGGLNFPDTLIIQGKYKSNRSCHLSLVESVPASSVQWEAMLSSKKWEIKSSWLVVMVLFLNN